MSTTEHDLDVHRAWHRAGQLEATLTTLLQVIDGHHTPAVSRWAVDRARELLADPAQPHSTGPESDVGETGRPAEGGGTRECVDCGHDFHPDSSPHLDRCWQCAGLDDDAEAGVSW